MAVSILSRYLYQRLIIREKLIALEKETAKLKEELGLV